MSKHRHLVLDGRASFGNVAGGLGGMRWVMIACGEHALVRRLAARGRSRRPSRGRGCPRRRARPGRAPRRPGPPPKGRVPPPLVAVTIRPVPARVVHCTASAREQQPRRGGNQVRPQAGADRGHGAARGQALEVGGECPERVGVAQRQVDDRGRGWGRIVQGSDLTPSLRAPAPPHSCIPRRGYRRHLAGGCGGAARPRSSAPSRRRCTVRVCTTPVAPGAPP